ncbi:adenine phosphoribosyltransferase [candidate division KSB1 bacterium]|nr:adenine phosphoribosyltransferase [candidate division KSB1 bacterium]NIR68699.1 adenine phosphoribosyltransferase [candidate division KSB1 bacterium]NIS25516.1 adenine phosphoribosyltransferase [candidate division KSB1 bacterium]NIT72409.1 adenine phosphoribosyltransferase [candidate division KSB1 bacterium]NIU26193.1 adenine phosphoribosyltransferase [candidate division KSB1 bacterium]
MADLQKFIRNVPDFPKKGIGFKDITTLLREGKVFHEAVDVLAEKFSDKEIRKIVGIESRGFIFGAALAYKWNIGFVPVRKPGKLPAATVKEEYELEYGTDAVEMHKDAVSQNEKVLIVDDLLATGGTAAATLKLVRKLGGDIQGVVFLIELNFLNGREKLKGYDVISIIQYDSE